MLSIAPIVSLYSWIKTISKRSGIESTQTIDDVRCNKRQGIANHPSLFGSKSCTRMAIEHIILDVTANPSTKQIVLIVSRDLQNILNQRRRLFALRLFVLCLIPAERGRFEKRTGFRSTEVWCSPEKLLKQTLSV